MAKLLGQYLLEMGVLTPAQLETALVRHADLARAGDCRFIGEILLEMGYITTAQLDLALRWQAEDRAGALIFS